MTYESEIESLRKDINRLNMEIFEKLAERAETARRIGEVKKKHGMPIVDRSREAKVYQQIRELAEDENLDPKKVEKVFKGIVELCTEVQSE